MGPAPPGECAVLALLIVFHGFYVAAEFSAVSVRQSRIRQMAEQGNGFARRLLPTLDEAKNLDRYIAACGFWSSSSCRSS